MGEVAKRDVLYDLISTSGREDPARHYEEVRSADWARTIGGIVVGRYDSARWVLSAKALGSQPPSSARPDPRPWPPGDPRIQYSSDELRLVLFSEGVDHVRRRRALDDAISAAGAEWVREFARGAAEVLVRQAVEVGAVEVMDGIAFPLAAALVAELLGLPQDKAAWLCTRGRLAGDILDPVGGRDAKARQADSEVMTLLASVVEDPARLEADSVLSRLLDPVAEPSTLSAGERLAMAGLLFGATFGPTATFIGNTLFSLATWPEEFERLRDEPTLLGTCMHELLRYGSPVHMTARYAMRDVEREEMTIAEGEKVVVCLGAANRDPDIFADPERLDLSRANANRHLSFSSGHHGCAGSAIAGAVGLSLLECLAEHCARLHLVGEPTWRRRVLLRGLASAEIAFKAAGRQGETSGGH